MVTCGVDGSIRLWQVRNGMLLRSFIGHEKEVMPSICMCAHIPFLFCDLSHAFCLDQVWHVTFSPDNKTLLSCSLDGTARMWHTGTGDELFHVSHSDTIHQGCFTPDGLNFATCSHDGVFKVIQFLYLAQVVVFPSIVLRPLLALQSQKIEFF